MRSSSDSKASLQIAANFSLNGFTDWFLPSYDELSELYLQKTVVGGFSIGAYWSSSEADDLLAWVGDVVGGGLAAANKDSAGKVRAVRAF